MRFKLLLLLLLLGTAGAQDRKVVVASKTFAESRVLGEMVAQLIETKTDLKVERRMGLGGTMVCFQALKSGEADIYVEYTGTALVTILKEEPLNDPLRVYLETGRQLEQRFGLTWTLPLGFNNTYALAMPRELAKQKGIRSISDLRGSEVQVGFTHEFLKRPDGWLGLKQHYRLDLPVIGVEHALAYEAIKVGNIQLMDAYTTDGKLVKYDLVGLDDDLEFFPPYQAVPMVRQETLERFPELLPVLNSLAYTLTDSEMQSLNFRAEEKGEAFESIASSFLAQLGVESQTVASPDRASLGDLIFSRPMLHLLGQHLGLTLVATGLATLLGVPLGIFISKREHLAQPVLAACGVVQTIPSLALLAFLIPIPFLGLGARSAILALFLYALLPIVRNTYTAIKEVASDLIEAARGMGLEESQILFKVQLPLSVRTIMAGIRTSTVIGVGIATLAAFIGAGGLGEPIITGLQLSDNLMILSGALPAAALALILETGLGRLERVLNPIRAAKH